MKKNKINLIQTFILIIIILIIIFVYLNNLNLTTELDYKVISTFFVIALLIIINIIMDTRHFSLNKIFWYFSFFFLFFSPLIQYISGYVMWGYNIDEYYTKANLLIIVWFLFYTISNKTYILKKEKIEKVKEINLNIKTLKVFLILSVLSFIIAIIIIGFEGLFIREKNAIRLWADNINTIITNLIRTVPVFSTLYAVYYYKKYKKGILYVIILFLITLLLNYPVSVTRYWIGAVYIGLFLVIFKDIIKNRIFDLGMIFVFLIVFPVFQLFKWYSLENLFSDNLVFNRILGAYNNADFDAYSMFARSFSYVEIYGITYGKQLLSSLLFLIPRSIWPNKSVHTGQLIAESQGQTFTNLSCPLIAEGYINFGYLGICIYAIIIAKLIKYFDNKFWNRNNKNNITYIDFIYPFLLGLLIFLLRGAFHPVVVYIFTFYLFIILWYWFQKVIRRKNERIN